MLDYEQRIKTKQSNDIDVTTWGDPDTKSYKVIMELSNRNDGNNYLAYLSLEEARELGESLIKAADHMEG